MNNNNNTAPTGLALSTVEAVPSNPLNCAHHVCAPPNSLCVTLHKTQNASTESHYSGEELAGMPGMPASSSPE